MTQNDLSWESDGSQDPLESPGAERDASATSDSEEQAFEVFIGPNNRGYYMNQYIPVVQSGMGETKFNWAAFFLTGIWMGYRKMYMPTAILWGIMIVIALIEEETTGQAGFPLSVDTLIVVVESVICGAFANRWYLYYVRWRISAARSQGHEGDDLMKVLEKRGGTSVLASLGILLLFIGLYIAIDFVRSLEFTAP